MSTLPVLLIAPCLARFHQVVIPSLLNYMRSSQKACEMSIACPAVCLVWEYETRFGRPGKSSAESSPACDNLLPVSLGTPARSSVQFGDSQDAEEITGR